MANATYQWNTKTSKYDVIHNGRCTNSVATSDKAVRLIAKLNAGLNTGRGGQPTKVVKSVVWTDPAIRQTLERQTKEVVDLAHKTFPNLQMAQPRVGFFQKSLTAGKAKYNQWQVEYNELIANENGLVKFYNTVIHEVAHLVTKKLYPYAKAHGAEFKHVMITLGGTGERCHNYSVASVQSVKKTQKRYVYACACNTHNISSVRHKRATIYKTVYRCKKCHVEIKFTGKVA